MDSAPPAPSVLDSLRTVEFRLGLKGYNVDEVDEYLEKAAVEAEAMKEQLRQANERLRQATERLAEADNGKSAGPSTQAVAVVEEKEIVEDDSLQRTLLLAQRFVDQTRRESEAEATSIVHQAEEQAHAIVMQAEDRALQLASDADRRLREEVARLEASRSQLASDVEGLARHLETERTRLRGSLNEMLKWLDEKVQPTASLMALRQRTAPPLTTGSSPTKGGGRLAGSGAPSAPGSPDVPLLLRDQDQPSSDGSGPGSLSEPVSPPDRH